MCEFYSPTGIVRRQLVSRHNVMIKPRLNIVAAGHPKRTIECLTGNILKDSPGRLFEISFECLRIPGISLFYLNSLRCWVKGSRSKGSK
jgi:hypothetical protein